MPKAMAPNAPCVEVCESPQAMVMPGCVSPSSGPMMCTMPWLPDSTSKNVMPNSAQASLSAFTMPSARLSWNGRLRLSVGMM